MMRRGILLRSSPLVYAQHLFLETSPECFKIYWYKKGWRRIIYVKIFVLIESVSILCHDGTDSHGTILQLLQHLNCHRSNSQWSMLGLHCKKQRPDSLRLVPSSGNRRESVTHAHESKDCSCMSTMWYCSSLHAKRLFIHACFLMKLAFVFYVKRFGLIEHHDGTVPCYNFGTTLTTLGSSHELAISLCSTHIP
jgi:hypothetical protein